MRTLRDESKWLLLQRDAVFRNPATWLLELAAEGGHMSTTRIYVVQHIAHQAQEKHHRLVEATSIAQAIRHCVKNVYAAKPATPKDIAFYMQGGHTIEKATEHEQTNQPPMEKL